MYDEAAYITQNICSAPHLDDHIKCSTWSWVYLVQNGQRSKAVSSVAMLTVENNNVECGHTETASSNQYRNYETTKWKWRTWHAYI